MPEPQNCSARAAQVRGELDDVGVTPSRRVDLPRVVAGQADTDPAVPQLQRKLSGRFHSRVFEHVIAGAPAAYLRRALSSGAAGAEQRSADDSGLIARASTAGGRLFL